MPSNDQRSPADSDWVVVGRAGRSHGLDGAFVVEDASEEASRYAEGATIYVRGRALRVVESKRARGRPVIRLEQPVDRGELLTVRRADLPSPAPDSFYVFQLVGLVVEEEGGDVLGRIADVAPGIANDVLELDSGLALPLVEDCVREIDLARERVVVARVFADPL